VEEVPGVNSQGETREELLSNLRERLPREKDLP
jgi:predicted RNase H-like HicB family nuclease